MMWFIPHNKKAILSLITGLCLLLCFLTGCKDTAPPATPAVVKKRIAQPPTATAPEKEKAAPVAETAQPQAPAKTEAKAVAPQPKAVEVEAAVTPETVAEETSAPAAEAERGILMSSFLETIPRYDPTGKVDPFAALFSEENTVSDLDDTRPKRPLTPLEKIDLSQLQLVAILQARSGNKAMVEDATGKGYVLTAGTFIGVNSGVITKILKDRIVVEEQSKDFLGKENTTTRELKLQKPFGEE